MEIGEVKTEAMTVVEEAHFLDITDSESHQKGVELWKNIKEMMKKVDETFKPIIQKAHQAHKEALAQRNNIFDPLDKASRIVKKAISIYDAEQERIRREEEERLREIARKEREEQAIEDAIEAEEMGDTEEAEAILDLPVHTPPVIVPKTTPKIKGGPVFREIWKFRITDEKKLPLEYLMPDSGKIGKVVRAMKEVTNIPGVEVYSDKV